MENAKPFLEVKKIDNLESYFIPNYQRPYKWRKENVFQLLDDLYENAYLKNLDYRVGSLIIHDDKKLGKKYIVDGQQRLTTLALIFKYLKEQEIFSSNFEFSNPVSKNNIAYNFQQIQNWFRSKNIDSALFSQKIKKNCEFAIITVYRLDEAFQLFDSQNSRGKELYPHDLLKAFHLREMAKNRNSDAEMQKYAVMWENYILKEGNPLLQILNNHLFRIRKWAKQETDYYFTKADIQEFKGISLYEPNKFNFETASRILHGSVETAMNNGILRNFQIAQDFPFQITMPIINGKTFFDYVFHYIETKNKMLADEGSESFGRYYMEKCENYHGFWRSGDQKVRNLFENLSLHYLDRFGKEYFTKDYYHEFYKNAYFLRLSNKSISDRSVINHTISQKIFAEIPNAYSPSDLHSSLFQNYLPVTDTVKGGDQIFKNFKLNNDEQ